MNLRFTPPVLVLALSIGASARVVHKANVGFTHSPLFQKHATEKFISRRRTKSITASIFNQEATTGRSFYNPDVGILLQDKTRLRHFGSVLKKDEEQRRVTSAQGVTYIPRFLQDEVAPLCGTNGTCPHNACACRANGDVMSDQCAPVINSLCKGYADADGNEWNIDRCINDYQDYPGLHEYAKTAYCQLSQCFDGGGTYGSCYCQLYQSTCELIGDERPYSYDSRALGFCAAAACCQNKTDEAGRVSCKVGAPSRVEYRHEHPRCGTNGTCYPGFCDAIVNAMKTEDYVAPFNVICNGVPDANGTKWGFEGCYRDYPDYPDYQLYAKTLNCNLINCFVDTANASYGSCYCQTFQSLCEVFGDVRKYDYHIPQYAGFCTIATCCQSKSSETGKLSCFELKNSTATATPTPGEGSSNPPAQNSSSNGADDTPDAITEDTPTNEPPSSSSPSAMPLSTVGALSSFVAASAVLSVLGCDAM